MSIVLVPYWIAEECYLSEALMWAAFQRYPKSEIIPDRVDMRFDPNYQEEYQPNIPNQHGYIESEEAVRVDLPPNPEWEALFPDDLIDFKLSPEHPEQYLAQEEERRKDQEQRQEEWNSLYEAYIERIQSKFFTALGDGKLRAYGRKLPHSDLKKAIKLMDKENNCSWFDIEHEEIPSDFWRFKQIYWDKSAAENGENHYCHIYLEMDNLLSVFPAPDVENTQTVSIIAGQYVPDDEQAPRKAKISNRGRKGYNWDDFHVEVADRINQGGLPKKQEAFIADMITWCEKKWGKKPGISTVSQKVSPYYDKFVRKKKK